jgi:hypothetical protein
MTVAGLSLTNPQVKATVRQGVVTVVIRDATGKPVAGARVSGRFQWRQGRAAENANGVTATSGSRMGYVTLRTKATWAAFDKSLQFCVTSVSKAQYTYNGGANQATCINVTPS